MTKTHYARILFAIVLILSMDMRLKAPGQTPPPPAPTQAQPSPQAATSPQAPALVPEPPGAIYKDAMHPLEVVRDSLGNWSEAELAALAVGMQKARKACDAAKLDDYQGDGLYDLAHLCAFGQDWTPANDAALKYVASQELPHRAQAYAISVSALVHIGALDLALATLRGEMGLVHINALDAAPVAPRTELLRMRLPYDADVAYTVRFMKDALEHAGSPEALALAGEEHASIVQALRQPGPLKATSGDSTISTGELYASAMELAFFNRFAGNADAAESAAADVDAALKQLPVISAEDQQEIDHVRTQYQLLGTHLPEVQPTRSLQSANAKPRIDPNFGAATVLVLFSDWCIECRELMKHMTKFADANSYLPIHAYGLLYSEYSPADALEAGKVLHAENEKLLAGTPTLEVPAQTAETFGVVDYPLGIVLDRNGIIRFIGVLPSDAFDENVYISKVLKRMLPKSTSNGK